MDDYNQIELKWYSNPGENRDSPKFWVNWFSIQKFNKCNYKSQKNRENTKKDCVKKRLFLLQAITRMGFVENKEEEAAKCLKEMDLDGDGKVSYAEFMVKWRVT